MAELLIKIGDRSDRPDDWKDGDVMCAFNRRHIRCCHAETICHIKQMPFTRDGLRPADCLAKHLRHETHQYQFRRVGQKAIEREELATGKVDTFGPEAIDVELYLQRRLLSGRHAVFGSVGSEFWYGGSIDVSHVSLDRVWRHIETSSSINEADEEFQLWPMGRLDIRHHLAVRVQDFDDAEAVALESPLLDKTDPENPVVVARRNVTIDWRTDLLDDLGVTERDVLDQSFPVGRDVVLGAGRVRYQSKDQPVQDSFSLVTNG